jgi:hypothetical protein
MKPTNLVLIIAMVLCMTLGVIARMPQQGSPPSHPVISLDFAQYCIGDSWKLKLSNSAEHIYAPFGNKRWAILGDNRLA